MPYEIVERGDTIYVRSKPDRSFESSSKNRKMAIYNFARIAHAGAGLPYEQFIEHMRKNIKPVGRTKKTRVIKMTIKDLMDIRKQMLRKGITRLVIPNVKIVVSEEKWEKSSAMRQ